MIHYLIAKWMHTPEGHAPDLPDNSGFLCLGGAGPNSLFGLFEVETREDFPSELSFQEVTPSLKTLLDSAHGFPPALAQAIEQMNQFHTANPQEFCQEMEQVLRQQLESQKTSRACLIRSRVEELGYRSEGEYVWVINYRPKNKNLEVKWISCDFQIYADSIETFDVDPIWLSERFCDKPSP